MCNLTSSTVQQWNKAFEQKKLCQLIASTEMSQKRRTMPQNPQLKFYKVKKSLPILITYREKLLNADGLRRRAFFSNHEGTFGNQEGMITWSWLVNSCLSRASEVTRESSSRLNYFFVHKQNTFSLSAISNDSNDLLNFNCSSSMDNQLNLP